MNSFLGRFKSEVGRMEVFNVRKRVFTYRRLIKYLIVSYGVFP